MICWDFIDLKIGQVLLIFNLFADDSIIFSRALLLYSYAIK